MSDAVTIIACICYVEWGLIHIAAGFLSWLPFGGKGGGSCTHGSKAGGMLHVALMGGLTAEQKASFDREYAVFSNRLGIQHGWNLLYVGVWSIWCLLPLLGEWRMAWGWGLHQYLFDWGYFMGIDWVHTGTGMGVAQTFIVSIGLFCSALSVKNVHGDAVSEVELALTLVTPCLLFLAGLFNLVRGKTCKTCMDCQPREDGVPAEESGVVN